MNDDTLAAVKQVRKTAKAHQRTLQKLINKHGHKHIGIHLLLGSMIRKNGDAIATCDMILAANDALNKTLAN